MNWMFFRSSSAPPRDPMQKRWRPLISKINWKKQKVRSTARLRNSQMASILYLFCYKSLRKSTVSSHESVKYKIEHLEGPLNVFSTRAEFLCTKPFQPCGFLGVSCLRSRVGWNSRCFGFSLPCRAPGQAATSPPGAPAVPLTKDSSGRFPRLVFQSGNEGPGLQTDYPRSYFQLRILQVH